jgi:hypothetical protein
MVEGIDHINAYSRSTLPIGRMMSNFYHFPVNTDEGVFQSVEAYYHYLVLPPVEAREELKSLYGYQALVRGRELKEQYGRLDVVTEEFHRKILTACWRKIKRHKYMFKEEYRNLPIVHYYNYGGKIVVPEHCEWWILGLNKIKRVIYESV